MGFFPTASTSFIFSVRNCFSVFDKYPISIEDSTFIYIYTWIHQFMILSHHLSLFYGFNLYLISYQNYHVGSGALLAVRLFSILASSYSCSPSIFMSQLGLWFGCVLAKNGFMVHHLKFEKINDLVCENS